MSICLLDARSCVSANQEAATISISSRDLNLQPLLKVPLDSDFFDHRVYVYVPQRLLCLKDIWRTTTSIASLPCTASNIPSIQRLGAPFGVGAAVAHLHDIPKNCSDSIPSHGHQHSTRLDSTTTRSGYILDTKHDPNSATTSPSHCHPGGGGSSTSGGNDTIISPITQVSSSINPPSFTRFIIAFLYLKSSSPQTSPSRPFI